MAQRTISLSTLFAALFGFCLAFSTPALAQGVSLTNEGYELSRDGYLTGDIINKSDKIVLQVQATIRVLDSDEKTELWSTVLSIGDMDPGQRHSFRVYYGGKSDNVYFKTEYDAHLPEEKETATDQGDEAGPEPGMDMSFEGSGDTISEPFPLLAGFSIFTITHSGEGRSVFELLDANNVRLQTLVDETVGFSKSMDVKVPADGKYRIRVKAQGEWSIAISRDTGENAETTNKPEPQQKDINVTKDQDGTLIFK